jgi:hypothetical protein
VPQAAAVPGVDDGDGDLGGLRAASGSDVAGDAHTLAARGDSGDGLVVVVAMSVK